MKTVKYKDWTFEVDYKRTKEAYDSLEAGNPDSCGCNTCKNFVINRENIYPEEIKKLLKDLGIDYKKEFEVYHTCKLEDGMHSYGGWFNFTGKIIGGKDCKIDLGNDGSTVNSVEVTDQFSIAFFKIKNLSNLDNEDFIQVEFFTNSEWVIERELEPN